MDPYLEAPTLWPDVHETLSTIIREQLTPLLAPKYITELHTQIVIEQPADGTEQVRVPDVSVARRGGTTTREPSPTYGAQAPLRLRVPMPIPTRLVTVHIRLRENDRLVTVIEVLSPVNKRPGPGRDEYLEKRASLLDSNAHLVEIDLLRRWPRMPLEGALPDSAYLIMVSAAYERPHCDVWPIGLQNLLPIIPIPLLRPDPPVPLNIGAALDTGYERARYDLRIDYGAPPVPPLSPEDEAWRAALLAERAE
jgi:hypothetical protein